MPTISIIIPCYNQELYIAECLDSVIAQTFSDFEAIVINDGSTDNSLQIIKEYLEKDNRIKLVNQDNLGVVSSRNVGLHAAQGNYIYPLDGDDKIAPNCLEVLLKAMQSNKGDVIYSQVEYFGSKTGLFNRPLPTKNLMANTNCVVSSALYKKADALKYGGYDINMNAGLEDWEFWCNFVFDNKKFYRVPEVLFFYRQQECSRNNEFSNETKDALKRYVENKHKLNTLSWAIKRKIFNLLKSLYNTIKK